jgi:hypothetical protein
MSADTDKIREEALRKLKGEAEGEGQRRKVTVRAQTQPGLSVWNGAAAYAQDIALFAHMG